MKGRTTLILIICIALLAAVIWIQESWVAGHAPGQPRIIRLFDVDSASLISLEFKLEEKAVRLAKENGIWSAGASPESMGPGDEQLIQQLIAGLNSMGRGTVITPQQLEVRGLDLAEYGFDRPSVKISTVDQKGARQWLVGRTTPLGNMVYVMESSRENIYAIPVRLLDIIPSDADQLRNRVLFPEEPARVKRIEIRGAAGFVQLLKDSKMDWQLHQPVSAKADSKEVQRFIEQLYRLRIEEFVADNVSDFSVYGLQDEARQISLVVGDGISRMLIIGDEVPDQPGLVYVRRADETSVYALSAEVLTLVDLPAERFRDATVLEFPKSAVSFVRIAHGGDEVVLSREPNGQWSITKPVSWHADNKEVLRMIDLWTDAVITTFDVAGAQADAEWLFEFGSIELSTTNTITVLELNGKKDGLIIRRNDAPTVYQINLPELPDSMAKPLTYKSKRVWNLELESIDRVEVIKANAARQVVKRQGDRTFSPAETNGNIHVDFEAVNRLMKQLSSLEADRHVAYNPRDLGIYGFTNPEMEIHVSLSATNELGRILLVGHETVDGFYSMVKGRDVVFYLSKKQVEELSAGLLIPLPQTVRPE